MPAVKRVAKKLPYGTWYPVVTAAKQTWVLEANIDDMNPQWFDFCMERLFEAGALDVWLEPIHMKKNRRGILLKVLCPARHKEGAIRIILQETTTLGVRYYRVKRRILERKLKTAVTRLGKIPVKIAWDNKFKIKKQIPEYEACRRLAKAKKISLREVYEEVMKKATATSLS